MTPKEQLEAAAFNYRVHVPKGVVTLVVPLDEALARLADEGRAAEMRGMELACRAQCVSCDSGNSAIARVIKERGRWEHPYGAGTCNAGRVRDAIEKRKGER